MGELAWLGRYPVKSMRGEGLVRGEVGPTGLAGDRRAAVVDVASGHVASAKHPRRWGGLLSARAWTSGDDIVIELPDGRTVVVGDAGADDEVSGWLGRPVRVTATPPGTATIERVTPETEPTAGEVVVRELGAGTPPGTLLDHSPLHLVTTASLAAAGGPDRAADARRVRPDLVIRTGEGRGFVEDTWVGRTLRVGGQVRLAVRVPTPRCAVPGLRQGDALAADPGLLRTLAAAHRIPVADIGRHVCLGVYATVVTPGTIRPGDRVELA